MSAGRVGERRQRECQCRETLSDLLQFFRWSRREDRPFVPLFDAPGARVTRITAPLPGRSLNPDFVFPSPPSSAGVGTGGKDSSKHTVKGVPPPAEMSFFSFSRKSSTGKGARLGWFGWAKSSSKGKVEISNPIPLRSGVSAINFGGGEKDEGIERLDESKGQCGPGLGIFTGHGLGDRSRLVDDGQRGLSGAALAAAVAGRTTSPLSALQHQARVVDVDFSSSVPPLRPNPTAKPLKSAMKSAPSAQSAKSTTDVPSPDDLRPDDELSYSFQTRNRDTSGRETLGGILSAYGRDSTSTGLAIGSPGDAERYASHLDAGPMPSSAIEERSPRRTFFGKAFDNGECGLEKQCARS